MNSLPSPIFNFTITTHESGIDFPHLQQLFRQYRKTISKVHKNQGFQMPDTRYPHFEYGLSMVSSCSESLETESSAQ